MIGMAGVYYLLRSLLKRLKPVGPVDLAGTIVSVLGILRRSDRNESAGRL